jgi:hypothetical protein
VQWLGRNVLSVSDFVFMAGYMELNDAEALPDALRGEITVNRVKRHFFERNYEYKYSVTPEAAEVARRGGSWMAVNFWRRGLFAVQYESMTPKALLAAMRMRATGVVEGGMPPGAVISADDAIARWEAGEKGYMRCIVGGKVRPACVTRAGWGLCAAWVPCVARE